MWVLKHSCVLKSYRANHASATAKTSSSHVAWIAGNVAMLGSIVVFAGIAASKGNCQALLRYTYVGYVPNCLSTSSENAIMRLNTATHCYTSQPSVANDLPCCLESQRYSTGQSRPPTWYTQTRQARITWGMKKRYRTAASMSASHAEIPRRSWDKPRQHVI